MPARKLTPAEENAASAALAKLVKAKLEKKPGGSSHAPNRCIKKSWYSENIVNISRGRSPKKIFTPYHANRHYFKPKRTHLLRALIEQIDPVLLQNM